MRFIGGVLARTQGETNMIRVTRLFFVAVVVSGFLFADSAEAVLFDLTSVIDGLQEVPPSGALGTGTGTMTYDDVTHLLSWDINWSGLTGDVTAMHFHGPAPPGLNAGVQVNIGAISGLTSPTIGSETISADQGTDLLDQLWYINIHTGQFPGGEIRGQVVPEPVAVCMWIGVLGGLAMCRRLPRQKR
jgi:hypothetical protein